MKLQDLYTRTIREAKDEEEVPADTATPTDEVPPEEVDAEETPTDEVPADDEDGEEDVGEIAAAEGFVKSKKEMFAFGKTRQMTLLTKNEPLGDLNLTMQYVINPATGAWLFQACLAGQSAEDMVEFDTGEDPRSLAKHLKKKKKITPHEAVEYLNPPADGKITPADVDDDETNDSKEK